MACSAGTCGTGLGNFPQPGDPDNNSVLSAVSKFGGIEVSWTYPELNPQAVAHTILYRSTSGTEENPAQYRVVTGDSYFDRTSEQSATAIEYFYWIKIVSVNGTEGELIGPVSATALPPLSQYIALLSGQIDNTALAQTLKDRIDQIDLANQSIQTEVANRISGENLIAQVVADMQDSLDGVDTRITQEIIDRSGQYSALVTQINAIAASSEDASALVAQEATARADGDQALAELISILRAEVEDTETGLPATFAQIQAEQTARADEDQALAGQITTLSAVVNDPVTGLAEAHAAIQLEETARIEGDEAIAQTVETLEVSVDGINGSIQVQATAIADLEQFETSATQTLSTLGGDVTILTGQLDGLSQDVTGLSDITIPGLSQDINDIAQDVSAIGLEYSVRLDNDGYVIGYGAYNNGPGSSGFIFRSDLFAVGHPGNDTIYPFIVVDGVVLINEAYISKLLFERLEATDGSLVVENGKLKSAYLEVANLIVQQAQSPIYISGQQGWTLDEDGTAEFNEIKIFNPDGTLAFGTGDNYLVTVDSVNTNVWLSEYYDFTIQEQGLGVKGLKLESYPNGIIPEEDYLDYGFGTNNGAIVGGLAPAFDDLPYTVSTKAHRVYPGRNYTIELDFLPYSPRVGSYQLRAYEYDSDLSAGVEYVVGAVGHSDPQCVLYDRSVLIDTSTYPQSAPYDVVLSEAYTPSSTARWVSFALAITSNGPDLVVIKTFGLKGQRTQVSSTFIEDAAIKAAHIEDASITSAKIKEAAIERLSILDGAVTAVAVAESDVQQEWYSETFAWQTFGTLLFTHEHETTLPCVLQQYVEYTDPQNAMEWRVRMDGVTQETFNGQMPPAYVLEVPPGGVTIELQGHALTSSVPARYWSVDKYVAHIEAGQR